MYETPFCLNKRLRTIFLVTLLIVQTGLLYSQINPPDVGEVFRDDVVPRIDITINEEMFNKLMSETESDSIYPVTFRFNNSMINIELDSVGFRLKGSFSRLADKKSFKLSVNAFKKGRIFQGIEDINLIANSYDPLMIRPRLANYLAHEIGITSLNTNYARFYINDIFKGIYVISEQIDKIFLAKWFDDNSGNLYKCQGAAYLQYISDNQKDYKITRDSWNGTSRIYDLKTNKEIDDYSDLVQFIKIANNIGYSGFKDSIVNYFNVQSYLKMYAFEIFIGKWDNYVNWGNNYMLYFNPKNSHFEYITYDTDLTFGINFYVNVGACNIYNSSNQLQYRPLTNNLLAVKEFRDMYTFYFKQIIAKFPMDSIRTAANLLRNKIKPYLFDDPYYSGKFSIDSFEMNMDHPVGFDTYGLMNFIRIRIDSTILQLENSNTAPIISNFKLNEVNSTDTLAFSCLVENEEEKLDMKLFYIFDNDEFDSIKMNLVKHSSIPMAQNCQVKLKPFNRAGTLKIRILATDEKGNKSYFPASGEYSVTIHQANPGLKVNEILAKNQYSITDEFGEHDDWLEIVNKDTVPVVAGNCYLSDDSADLGKWRLPDRVLNPGQLMYVWVDDDRKQGDYHANFKLSGDGETIYLSTKHDTIFYPLDSMTFSVQQTDISFGPEIEGSKACNFLKRITPGYTNRTEGLAFAIFNVDVARQIKNNNFIVDKDEVDVVGNFNNWEGTNPFSDPNRDSIYTHTVMGLSEGDAIEYRFRLRNNNNNIEFSESLGPEKHRKATLSEGCNTFNLVFNDEFNSVSRLVQNESLKLYPNPVKDQLHLNAQYNPDKVIIFNSMGQRVLEVAFAKNTIGVIDVSSLTAGIYLVKAFCGKNVYAVKMVKN